MPLTMTCPRCGGEIEYDTEDADSGDGVWAQSYRVGYVRNEKYAHPPAGEGPYRTACGCWWTEQEIEELDYRASELAAEGPSEP